LQQDVLIDKLFAVAEGIVRRGVCATSFQLLCEMMLTCVKEGEPPDYNAADYGWWSDVSCVTMILFFSVRQNALFGMVNLTEKFFSD
jgi:hypothetical protein